MPYTSPAAITTGTVISKSTFGDVVKADLDFLASPPACRVYGAGLATSNNTLTAITFNAERYDTNTMHDNVTNNTRITFNTAGVYIVTGHVEWQTSGVGVRTLTVYLNGTGGTRIASSTVLPLSADPTDMSISTTYKFGVGDYIVLAGTQTSGGVLNVSNVSNYSPEFSATWVGLGT